MLNPKINVGKLKKAYSLSNLHISKMAGKLREHKYGRLSPFTSTLACFYASVLSYDLVLMASLSPI